MNPGARIGTANSEVRLSKNVVATFNLKLFDAERVVDKLRQFYGV
jgi:hypothetical protein